MSSLCTNERSEHPRGRRNRAFLFPLFFPLFHSSIDKNLFLFFFMRSPHHHHRHHHRIVCPYGSVPGTHDHHHLIKASSPRDCNLEYHPPVSCVAVRPRRRRGTLLRRVTFPSRLEGSWASGVKRTRRSARCAGTIPRRSQGRYSARDATGPSSFTIATRRGDRYCTYCT